MFRKVSHIFLVIVLLTTTIGFKISKHYCGDKLIKTTFLVEAESCCGDATNSDCCHNENEFCQLENDFVSPIILEKSPIPQLDTLIPVVIDYLTLINYQEYLVVPIIGKSPPPLLIQTKLSFLQSFII